MFRVRLNPFYNLEGDIGDQSGVDSTPAAEVQTSEGTESTTGDNQAAAEPGKQNNFEKAFAKRLSEAQSKWEADKQAEIAKLQEQYKDYDTHKELSSYLQQINGLDAMTLKERIELEKLQDRAEKENVPPEVLKRIDMLEAKAAKADALEQQQQQSQQYQEFRTNLEKFASEKSANADELHKYMFDNHISSMDVAYKAMRADQLEQQLATAKEDSIKEYLASKKGPRVEGSTGAAGTQTVDTSKMSWKDLDRHALARLEAAKTPQ